MEEKPNSATGGTPPPNDEKKKTSPRVPPTAATQSAAPADGVSSGPKAPVPFYQELYWSKRFWLGVILFGIFLYFTTAVPVSKIPFLRNLVEAMGYTEPETHNISFFKALLSWNEHAKHVKAQAAEEQQARDSEAKAMSSALEGARLSKGGLFNLREVNRSLRAQGKQPESVNQIGTRYGLQQGSPAIEMSGKETKVNTQPQGTGEVPEEVFFGRDNNTIERDKNSGFDSTKQLANVKLPMDITSSHSDWTIDQADSFWGRKGGIIFNNKLLDVGDVGRTPGRDILSVSDVKPRADMIYAWMTSRASRRVENKALKQTLNAAGFMGADLSRPMLITALEGVGSLQMDANEIRLDFADAKERMKLEEDCTEALNGPAHDTIMQKMKDLQDAKDSLLGFFPKDCKNLMKDNINLANDFNTAVTAADDLCGQIKTAYGPIKSKCNMEFTNGNCQSNDLKDFIQKILNACNDKYEECYNSKINAARANGQTVTDQQKQQFEAACYSNVTNAVKNMQGNADIFTQDRIQAEVEAVMKYNPDGTSDYYTTVNWAATLRNRQYGGGQD